MKKLLLRIFFTKKEVVSIINALYRRSIDNTTRNITGDLDIKNDCKRIADQIMLNS